METRSSQPAAGMLRCVGGFWLSECSNRLCSWVGDTGTCSGPTKVGEADRVGRCLLIPSPRTTGVVGMERYGHSQAGLNHIRRSAPSLVGS